MATKVICSTCVKLNLTVEKFTINDGGPREEQPMTIEHLQKQNEPISHGKVDEIRSRSQLCDLCTIIIHSLDGVKPDVVGNAECLLRWEIDGRNAVDFKGHTGSPVTKRLLISWANPRLQYCDSYLVLGAPEPDFNVNFNYRDRLGAQNRFLGRSISSVVYRRNLIREFLRICERDHSKFRCSRNLGNEDPFSGLKHSSFGVIDIQNSRLANLPFRETRLGLIFFEPYAAMSYVWGNHSSTNKTNISNVKQRYAYGGLADVIPDLPRSVKEGLDLALGLGIRYIWVDALCIVQDSSVSWKHNSAIMDQIYGNATITICAADGKDPAAGLTALHEDHHTPQYFCQYSDLVRLILHQPPEASIAKSEWNTRAWTFQERLLSKCCLIFTGGRVHFQCRSACMSEDIFADRKGRGWSLDLVHAPLQLLPHLRERAIWCYAHCVALYTQRNLYERFDILAAFKGMGNVLELRLRAPIFFGLPTSHFDFALLWVPVSRALPLKHPRDKNSKYVDLKFPSWSWCGWITSGVKYDPDIVAGCTQDMSSWLEYHTWIDWHIRDKDGRLQRVWAADRSRGDKSLDAKWGGYEPFDHSDDDEDSDEDDADDDDDDADDDDADYGNKRYGDDNAAGPARSHESDRDTREDRVRENKIGKEKNAVGRQGKDKGVRFNDETSSRYDLYGRPFARAALRSVPKTASSDFELILPEYPSGVSPASNPFKTPDDQEDHPLLQFFTWMAEFHVVSSTTAPAHENLHDELRRCHITDLRGNKCGSIVVDAQWLGRQENADPPQTKFKFIAISEAKSFTQAEFPDWTYYVPKEREESEWDLFFVLLVEFEEEEGVHRRVALGKIFQAAFKRTSEEWEEIILG